MKHTFFSYMTCGELFEPTSRRSNATTLLLTVFHRKLWRKSIKGPYTAQAEVTPTMSLASARGKEPKVKVSLCVFLCDAFFSVGLDVN